MANYKHHIMFGGFFTILLLIFAWWAGISINFVDYLAIFVAWLVYSQLPDIDTQASKIRWIFTVGSICATLYFILISNKSAAIFMLLTLLFVWCMKYIESFTHRGITHTFLTGFVLSTPFFMFGYFVFIVALVNYSSHLIADKIIKEER